MSAPVNKAVFLDRDGVINEDVGYAFRPQQIVFKPDIFEFCRQAAAKGYLLVVVTNQSGIARGLFSEADLALLHDWMGERFREQGVPIAKFYYCPYHRNGVIAEYTRESDDRKPGPGMFLRASEELSIDLARSFMIGDKQSDRIRIPRLKSIIIKSSYTPQDYDVEQLSQVTGML